MAREPELGIKVKIEPQIKQKDILDAIKKSTPDNGFGIEVKINNVARAMKDFSSSQTKNSSLWPLINVKIGNAKQALDTAFKNATINVNANIQSSDISKIKSNLEKSLNNISINIDTNKIVKASQEIKKNISSDKSGSNGSGISLSDQKLLTQYENSLKRLFSLREKISKVEDPNSNENAVLQKKYIDEQANSQNLYNNILKKGLETTDKAISATAKYSELINALNIQNKAIEDSIKKKENDVSNSKLIKEYERSLKSLSNSDKNISKLGSDEYDTNAINISKNIEKATESQKLLEEIKERGLDSDERVLSIQKQYEDTLSAIVKQQDAINKKKSEKSELSENTSLLNSYQKSLEKIVSLRNQLSKKSSSEDGSNALLNKKLTDEEIESEKLKDQIYKKGLNTTEQYSKIEKDYATSIAAVIEQEKARQKTEEESTKVTIADTTALEKKINILNGFKTKLQKNNLSGSAQIDEINQITNYSNRLQELLSLYGNKNIAAQKFGTEFDLSGINTYKDAVDYIENRVSQIRKEVNDILDKKNIQKSQTQSKTALNNLASMVRDYYDKNTNIIGSSLENPFEKLIEDLKAPGAANNVVELRNRFSELRTATKELGLETDTLLEKFKNLFSQHFSTMITMEALHLIEQSLQVIYQNIVEIDYAMTELKKVTDETASGYEQFMDRASDSATKLGVSISDYINSTADWARLGYSLPDAEEMAEMSTLLSNVGDGISTASQAGEYLISIMQGFGYAADDAEKIVDIINEVANTQPIDAYGISEILTRSAAAMSAANNSLEETIALGTAANAVVQDPEKVGNALKSISLFLRAAKTDAEEAGIAVDGMANSVSELREDVKSIAGVDIMADTAGTQFKSTYDILKEISEVWDNLTDVDQANLTEMLAGKQYICQYVQKCA